MVVYFNDKGEKGQSNLLQMEFMYVIKITACEISPNKGSKFKPFMWEDGPNLWIVCVIWYINRQWHMKNFTNIM